MLLPRCSGSCVFAIICHMATVLWVQAEMCDGSVHSLAPHHRHLPVAALPSPSAHFHYPGGIQGVMASRAAVPASWAQTFPGDCSGEPQKEIGTECWNNLHFLASPMRKRPVALQTRWRGFARFSPFESFRSSAGWEKRRRHPGRLCWRTGAALTGVTNVLTCKHGLGPPLPIPNVVFFGFFLLPFFSIFSPSWRSCCGVTLAPLSITLHWLWGIWLSPSMWSAIESKE